MPDYPDEIHIVIPAEEIEAILNGADIPAELAAAMEAADWEIDVLEPAD